MCSKLCLPDYGTLVTDIAQRLAIEDHVTRQTNFTICLRGFVLIGKRLATSIAMFLLDKGILFSTIPFGGIRLSLFDVDVTPRTDCLKLLMSNLNLMEFLGTLALSCSSFHKMDAIGMIRIYQTRYIKAM